MSDTFPSQEFPGKTLKVDPAGKAAEPILNAIADKKPDRADALLARIPRDLKPEVVVILGRYFPEYRMPGITCAVCKQMFTPPRRDSRCCSDDCRKTYANTRKRERKDSEKR